MARRSGGRWPGWGRATCEERLALDVRAIVRHVRSPVGQTSLSWTWTDSIRSTVLGTVGLCVDLGARELELCYACDGKPVVSHVQLDTTTPNFGGVRWWLQCPACAARMAILYFNGDRFHCRGCARLAYESTRENALLRAFRRARKLEERLARCKWTSTRVRSWAQARQAYADMAAIADERWASMES